MPQVYMFILIRLNQHVSDIIMPIIRRTDYVNNCMWIIPTFTKCTQLVSQPARLQPTQPGICLTSIPVASSWFFLILYENLSVQRSLKDLQITYEILFWIQ